jgi:nucleoside 2-deoxyribosyltransferase
VTPDKATCPICKRGEGVSEKRIAGSIVSYDCPVCGHYEMSPFDPDVLGVPGPNHKLSAWIREQNERRIPVRFVHERMIPSILAGIPDYRPLEKQLKLLQALERRSITPGDKVKLNLSVDFPLAYASNSEELAFYLRSLRERTLTEPSPAPISVAMITSAGWDYLDKHASDLKEKTQAFVAMSFSDSMKPIWEDAIKPAIQRAGYTAYRIDEEPHSDNIIFKIMAEIKNSRFVVADITEQRNGVYFEAGYGLGLGLPVIWSVRKDDADNVHFDTAQYNQIRWESAKELEEGLFDYICAIIGQRSRPQT